MNILIYLVDRDTYTLIFKSKVVDKEKSDEDILCEWNNVNPCIEKLITEFNLEL